jgi:hypothetical protein
MLNFLSVGCLPGRLILNEDRTELALGSAAISWLDAVLKEKYQGEQHRKMNLHQYLGLDRT